MALSINTNVSSLNAQRNLSKSQGDLQTSFQRLSSGLRINGAKDDAAGLAISNRFTTQVRGLNVAVRNANDGISFAQTTEGALTEVSTALQRIRDLAVQSANDTNSASDRQSLQAEVSQLVSEIDRISETTNFNGSNVLDGSKETLKFHIGANSNQTVSVAGVDAKSSSLGSQPGVVETTGGRVAVLATTTGTQGLSDTAADAISITSFTVRTADVEAADAVDVTDVKYGGNIDLVATADLQDRTNANYGSGQAKAIAERINDIRSDGDPNLQGVYASAVTTFQGSDLVAADYAGAVDVTENSTSVGAGKLDNGELNINGVDIGPATFQAGDADGSLTNAINAKSDVTGVEASINKNGELILTADDGRDIVVTVDEDTAAGVGTADDAILLNDLFGGGDELTTDRFDQGVTDLRATGRITISGNDTIVLGGNDTELGLDAAGLALDGSVENGQAQGTIANADVTTAAASNSTIEAVDSALAQVNSFRADLGAVQNRFESTIRNLSSVSESLSAANSRILDADFASETAALSKNQVLQQAGISVLAQANALPQQALSLLG
ncbi:flagellin [Gammaproteobacteria bacterium 42_54_T18]|nr:flagellin [Gammaproteobacteria bacterium 42_54_T18]